MNEGYTFRKSTKAYLCLKRFVDVFGALLAIIVLSWLLLICAILTFCTSKGPIIFSQKRVGRHQKIFHCYKFRSMKVGSANVATSHIDNSTQDNMVTKWGHIMRKTSLDELPQLFNILKGDMSFIGPRPGQPAPIEEDLIQARLSYVPNAYEVRPGLSGYAQIYMDRHHEADKKARYDSYYVAHIGLWLDVKLFLLSFLVLFGFRPGR